MTRTPRLFDEVRAVARMRHLSIRTEQSYVNWIKRFVLFHQEKHPRDMSEHEIREFISHLAVNDGVSASTQTVALRRITQSNGGTQGHIGTQITGSATIGGSEWRNEQRPAVEHAGVTAGVIYNL